MTTTDKQWSWPLPRPLPGPNGEEPACPCGFIRTVKDDDGDETDIYWADGKWIRWWRDVGFIGGGHDDIDDYLVPLIDRYGPGDEPWSKARPGAHLIVLEAIFYFCDEDSCDEIGVHESSERESMGDLGLKYDPAHYQANEDEAAYNRGRWGVPSPHNSDGDY